MRWNNLSGIALLILSVLLIALTGCSASSPPDGTDETATASNGSGAADEGQGAGDGAGDDSKEAYTMAKLLYQGHGSLRITTADGKVIYVDPYAGEGYDLPADLILVTHQHSDHNKLNLIKTMNPECVIITEKEALKDGEHQSFDLGYATVEATLAGNKNHDPGECVGYLLALPGLKVYVSGDTSRTAQMETFADRGIDYALLCCDGEYNMGLAEASECAALIGARYTIPYHMAPGKLFDSALAGQFAADNRLIVTAGEEIDLEPLGC